MKMPTMAGAPGLAQNTMTQPAVGTAKAGALAQADGLKAAATTAPTDVELGL